MFIYLLIINKAILLRLLNICILYGLCYLLIQHFHLSDMAFYAIIYNSYYHNLAR